ncbi:hypothetical protein [Rossellomorea vietnamensis]|nr:hypothetical protein [Rossellomorea vietnamensis]
MIYAFGNSMMAVRLSGCIDFCLAGLGDGCGAFWLHRFLSGRIQ